jgi:hypothetical protein
MRNKTVNYWLNQLISAEEKNSKSKEPQEENDLSFQIAQYYVTKVNNNQSKVA